MASYNFVYIGVGEHLVRIALAVGYKPRTLHYVRASPSIEAARKYGPEVLEVTCSSLPSGCKVRRTKTGCIHIMTAYIPPACLRLMVLEATSHVCGDAGVEGPCPPATLVQDDPDPSFAKPVDDWTWKAKNKGAVELPDEQSGDFEIYDFHDKDGRLSSNGIFRIPGDHWKRRHKIVSGSRLRLGSQRWKGAHGAIYRRVADGSGSGWIIMGHEDGRSFSRCLQAGVLEEVPLTIDGANSSGSKPSAGGAKVRVAITGLTPDARSRSRSPRRQDAMEAHQKQEDHGVAEVADEEAIGARPVQEDRDAEEVGYEEAAVAHSEQEDSCPEDAGNDDMPELGAPTTGRNRLRSPRRSAEHEQHPDVQITDITFPFEVAVSALRNLWQPEVKEEPAPGWQDDAVGGLAPASAESIGAEPAGPLNRALLRDILRAERCRYKQLDPAQDAGASQRWSGIMDWYAIDDLRFRASHNEVSPTFTHGPHAGMRVQDLVECFMRDDERPEGLTPLVAARWRGALYVIFGNRRMWALTEFNKRHGPWTGRVPEVRVIVHDFPFEYIQPDQLRFSFQLKALDAMSSENGGLQAVMQHRRR